MRNPKLEIGDNIYCVKEHKEKYNSDILAKIGDVFEVISIDISDDTYQISRINDRDDYIWVFYTKNNEVYNKLGYIWDFFISKTHKAERIRTIAKHFVK